MVNMTDHPQYSYASLWARWLVTHCSYYIDETAESGKGNILPDKGEVLGYKSI